MLASFLHTVVLNHRGLEDALSFILAEKLGSPIVGALTLRDLTDNAFRADPEIGAAARADLQAVVSRDPACSGYSQSPLPAPPLRSEMSRSFTLSPDLETESGTETGCAS